MIKQTIVQASSTPDRAKSVDLKLAKTLLFQPDNIVRVNLPVTEYVAHRLKSSSATRGAMKLYHWCQNLEVMSKGITTKATLVLVSYLEPEHTRVETTLWLQPQREQQDRG